MQQAALPPFPPSGSAPALPLSECQDLVLRALHTADLPWLRELYAQTRADELAAVPWPDAMRRAFLDQQFDLQHRHFIRDADDTAYLAIEHDGAPVGRLYLRRTVDTHWIVDIALDARARGRGWGTALLRAVQADAQARGADVALHVLYHNPRARSLYARLGFVVEDEGDTHARMRWRAAAVS